MKHPYAWIHSNRSLPTLRSATKVRANFTWVETEDFIKPCYNEKGGVVVSNCIIWVLHQCCAESLRKHLKPEQCFREISPTGRSFDGFSFSRQILSNWSLRCWIADLFWKYAGGAVEYNVSHDANDLICVHRAAPSQLLMLGNSGRYLYSDSTSALIENKYHWKTYPDCNPPSDRMPLDSASTSNPLMSAHCARLYLLGLVGRCGKNLPIIYCKCICICNCSWPEQLQRVVVRASPLSGPSRTGLFVCRWPNISSSLIWCMTLGRRSPCYGSCCFCCCPGKSGNEFSISLMIKLTLHDFRLREIKTWSWTWVVMILFYPADTDDDPSSESVCEGPDRLDTCRWLFYTCRGC